MSRREKIETMLKDSPTDSFLNFALGVELAKEGRIEDSISQFDRVTQLDPAYTTAHFQKANTLIAAGRVDDARAALEAGILAANKHGDPHAAEEMAAVLATL